MGTRRRSARAFGVLTYAEGSLAAVTTNFGDGLVGIWLAASGLGLEAYALVVTLPLAIGALAQATVPCWLDGLSRRRIVILMVALQTLGLAVTAAGPLSGTMSLPLVMLGLVLYAVGGSVASPAWQAYVSGLMPRRAQNRFFARRTAALSLVTMASLLLSGWLLGDRPPPERVGWLLLAGCACRALSIVLLALHPADLGRGGAKRRSAGAEAASLWSPALVGLCLVSFLFRAAANLSSPHYAPYMMQVLGLPVLTYTLLCTVPLLTRFFLMANVGRAMDASRTYEALTLTLLGVAAIPALWTGIHSVGEIAAVQVLSGISWGGFELVSVLVIQRLFPKHMMTALGFYLCAGSLGAVVGSVAGGYLIQHAVTTYAGVFGLSAAMRLLTGYLLLREIRKLGAFRWRKLRVLEGTALMLVGRPLKRRVEELPPEDVRSTG